MSISSNIKNKISEERNAMKMDREFRNDPAVIKSQLAEERGRVKTELIALKEKKQLENDKLELQSLRNSTGLRGKISSGFGALRSHLDNVKQRNASLKVQDPLRDRNSNPGMMGKGMHEIRGSNPQNDSFGSKKSLVTGQVGSGSGGVFGGAEKVVQKKSAKKGRTIVIKL